MAGDLSGRRSVAPLIFIGRISATDLLLDLLTGRQDSTVYNSVGFRGIPTHFRLSSQAYASSVRIYSDNFWQNKTELVWAIHWQGGAMAHYSSESTRASAKGVDARRRGKGLAHWNAVCESLRHAGCGRKGDTRRSLVVRNVVSACSDMH